MIIGTIIAKHPTKEEAKDPITKPPINRKRPISPTKTERTISIILFSFIS